MMQDRYLLVTNILGQANQRASDIRSEANQRASDIRSEADAKVIQLIGEAEAEAAKSLGVFQQNPELAIFRLKLKALEDTLKQRATLILDQRTPPYDLLDGASGSTAPGQKK
jgi:regulator of protease activity HflC (stomatin/prohibitin superfamily)